MDVPLVVKDPVTPKSPPTLAFPVVLKDRVDSAAVLVIFVDEIEPTERLDVGPKVVFPLLSIDQF